MAHVANASSVGMCEHAIQTIPIRALTEYKLASQDPVGTNPF